jgi:thiopurine S-methyltransferase
MDHQFWHERWIRHDIGFHQKQIHELLVRHWPALKVPAGSSVFVPLCGKSLDMSWLAAEGHRVIGTELSVLAIDAFMSGQALDPAVSYIEGFEVKRAGPFELWLGDHFAMPPGATSHIAAVYDRAALVAMPRTLQTEYAAKLAELTPKGVPVLLISLDYDPSEITGPPFPVPNRQVVSLFGPDFRIELLETRDGLEGSPNLRNRGLCRLAETAFKLVRR